MWGEPEPIASVYGIFTYIFHKNQPNVGKYTIHGCYVEILLFQHMFFRCKDPRCESFSEQNLSSIHTVILVHLPELYGMIFVITITPPQKKKLTSLNPQNAGVLRFWEDDFPSVKGFPGSEAVLFFSHKGEV